MQGQVKQQLQQWPLSANAQKGQAPSSATLERKATVPRDEPIPAGCQLPSRPVQLGVWDSVSTTADMAALPGEGGPAGGILRVYCTSWNMAGKVRPRLPNHTPGAAAGAWSELRQRGRARSECDCEPALGGVGVPRAKTSVTIQGPHVRLRRLHHSQEPPESLIELLTWARPSLFLSLFSEPACLCASHTHASCPPGLKTLHPLPSGRGRGAAHAGGLRRVRRGHAGGGREPQQLGPPPAGELNDVSATCKPPLACCREATFCLSVARCLFVTPLRTCLPAGRPGA